MDHIKILSVDGECELNILKNYMNMGIPGVVVRYMDESGVAQSREFPLGPEQIVPVLSMLVSAQGNMLQFLAKHLHSNVPTSEDLIGKAAHDADLNILQFKKRD